MQKEKSPLANLVESLILFLRKKGEHVAYSTADELAQIITKLALLLIAVLIFIAITFFLSMAFSHAVGVWLNIGPAGGFAVVGGLFILLAIATHLSRKQIGNFILNKLAQGINNKMSELFESDDTNE